MIHSKFRYNHTSHPFLSKRFVVVLILLLTACNTALNIAATAIVPTATSTLGPSQICPKPGDPGNPIVPSSMNISWVKQAIEDYLDHGGNPEKLTHLLTTPE